MFSSVLDPRIIELVCIFFSIVLLSWYLYYSYCFTYWKKKGIPSVTPSFPAGNMAPVILGTMNISNFVDKFYKEFKSKGYKHGGLYFCNGPVYLPIDPAIVKSIMTTDFEHFVDRGTYFDEEKFPISGHIFSLRGSRWRNLRNKLSPTFTSGKLKTMYEIFIKMTENFVKAIEPKAEEGAEINIKYISTNFTADLIWSTAFGLDGDTLKNPNGVLANFAINLFRVKTWNFFKALVTPGLQNPGNIFRANFNDRGNENFLDGILKNTIKHRDENKVDRKDFLSLLLEIRDNEGLSYNEILSQSFLFFLAGFETSSQTISYCIHELAHNQELQDRLRHEIHGKLGKDYRKYTYDEIFGLPYLDKVFNETLRKYPVLGFFNRICVKAYQVPGTNVIIEEGTPVLLPVLGLQRDPEYFPDPLKFDPERFNEDQSLVPGTFLPFGEGPRFCIGKRYGKLQTKLGIAALISQFKFFPSQKTPRYVELDKAARNLTSIPAKGIIVKVVKL